jgi:hyperosmotically inducible periplasmic protein
MRRNTTSTLSIRALFIMVSMISAFALTACGGGPHSRTTGTVVDDAWITSKVKTSLLGDDLVSGTDVIVETYQGSVMLSGFVDAENQMDRAVEIAKSVEGVKKVVNNMALKSKQMGERGASGETGTSDLR